MALYVCWQEGKQRDSMTGGPSMVTLEASSAYKAASSYARSMEVRAGTRVRVVREAKAQSFEVGAIK